MLADLAVAGPARRRAARPARRDGAGGPGRRRGRPDRGGTPRRRPVGADRGDARLPRQPHARPWSRAPISCTATRPTRTWTWPERGVEAGARLAEVIAGRLRPTAAFRKPPLMPPLGSQGTARGPMRRLYDLADEMEKDPAVISISIFAGFPYADIPEAGLGIYVVTNDDRALAETLAERAGPRGVGAPARVHAHRAARARRGGRGARRRRPPDRARRHGRQHGRRRGGRRHRDPARAGPGARALRASWPASGTPPRWPRA